MILLKITNCYCRNSSFLFFLSCILLIAFARPQSKTTSIEAEYPEFKKSLKCPLHFHDSGEKCAIGTNYGQIQTYGPFTYLHPGIDILGAPGQNVYSISNGIVKSISVPEILGDSPASWRIVITDGISSGENKGYLYAHLQRESIPFEVGDTITEGQFIGKLYKWHKEDYTHVHFSEILDEGTWNGEWLTIFTKPLIKHGLPDVSSPIFENADGSNMFAFIGEQGEKLSPDSIAGNIRIIFKCYDYINSNYKTTVSDVEYEIFQENKGRKSVTYIKQNYLLGINNNAYKVNLKSLHIANIFYSLNKPFQSVDTGDNDTREFFYYLQKVNPNLLDELQDGNSFINLHRVPSGEYVIKITVKDYYGNQSSSQMKINIVNKV